MADRLVYVSYIVSVILPVWRCLACLRQKCGSATLSIGTVTPFAKNQRRRDVIDSWAASIERAWNTSSEKYDVWLLGSDTREVTWIYFQHTLYPQFALYPQLADQNMSYLYPRPTCEVWASNSEEKYLMSRKNSQNKTSEKLRFSRGTGLKNYM